PRLVAYFEDGGYLYLVQEFIEGKNLQAELAEAGTFTEAKIKALLHGLLPILQFVHSRNIIHRDLKPDNIMRRPNGDLVLIDFGVAKLLAQSGIASFGAFGATTIGTPGYASPEQMQGRVTPASDLFALGATCYQLLTNRFADGQTSLVGYSWTQNWQQNVKHPISDELAALLTRLIATDEGDRYPTATAVLRDLSSNSPPAGGTPATPQGLLSTLPTVVAQRPAPSTPAPSTPAPTQTPPPAPAPLTPPPAPAPVAAPAVQPAPQPLPIQPLPIQPSPTPPPPVPQKIAALASPSAVAPAVAPAVASTPSQSPPVHTQRIGYGFWIKYGLLTYIGQALGLLLAMVTVAFLATLAGMDSDGDMPAVLNYMKWAYWPASGITIGIAQWLALRKWVPKALLWMPATMAMFWAIALIRITISSPSFLPLALFVGTLLALPQWWVIRKCSPRAIAWIPWIAVMSTLLFRVLIKNDFLTMFSWGLVGPVLDSLFLMWILKKPTAGLTRTEGTATH
ncbi:MAG: serine/threonine-protein kinase, partial [Cyanobacteria bacterium J06598_3]